MKRVRHHWRMALAASVLLGSAAACSSKKDEPQVDPNVVPTNYKQRVIDVLRPQLDDPTGIRDAALSDPMLRPVGGVSRQVVCVRFNPKDFNGQYVGVVERVGIFYGGQMSQLIKPERENCAGAVYRPFPELMQLCRELTCPRR